jgi:putative ABC transport system permease protein
MIRIYLLQAIRSLKNQKTHFLIILIGLSFSLASAFLIYSYVFFENSYDSFYQSNNIYRIIVDAQREGEDAYKSPYSFSAQGPTAKAEIPEIIEYTRIASSSDVILSSNQSANKELAISVNNYYYADDNFFELFSFPLIHGSANQVLKNKESIVISESLSRKLFGTDNPIGKVVTIDGKWLNTVTGVMKDIPENTHLKFEMILPMKNNLWLLNPNSEWTNHSYFTYVELKKNTKTSDVEKKITSSFLKENRAVNQSECTWHLQPVNEAYLQTSDFTSKPSAFKFGDPRMVYFLIIIIFLIISVSWVNYINLITARKDERLEEVKVRRVNGADRRNLINQFFIESVFQNLLGIIIACLIIVVSIRPFAKFMGFTFNEINNPSFWLIPVFVVIFSIVIPGLYSSLLLAQNKTQKKPIVNSTFFLRNTMLVLQFIIIIALLSSVFVINKQLDYINHSDLGFNKEQVLVLNIPRVTKAKFEKQDLETFRSELVQYPGILDVSATTTIPGKRFGNGNGGLSVLGQSNEDTYFRIGRVMNNYPALMNFRFVAGHSFSNSDNEIIINEAAVKELGFSNSNELINRSASLLGRQVTIVGVTEDFHQESLHIIPEPQIMFTKDMSTNYNNIVVRVLQGNVQSLLSIVEKAYKTQFPGNPLSYFFLDEYFDYQYQKDIKFRKLFSMFSILALIIGYIGLYGLTTYIIVKRTKEIGVRKVNGAKISEILSMLNKDIVKWVFIAFIIATPVAYFAMGIWLKNFAYKTNLNWWIFAISGIIALGSALFTVSWQSWKAAMKNPVEALRYE